MKTKNLFNAIVIIVLSLPLAMSCSQGVEIDGLVWAKENVGISKTTPYVGYCNFTIAQTACPEGWRLPTEEEFKNLSRNYSEVMEHNGIRGRWFSGSTPYKKGVKAVLLPMAGCDVGDSVASSGYYWSSTGNDSGSAYRLFFAGSVVGVYGLSSSNVFSVRCLKN